MVRDVIQESTDAIYRFEDDSISLADSILKQVIRKEILDSIFTIFNDQMPTESSEVNSLNIRKMKTSHSVYTTNNVQLPQNFARRTPSHTYYQPRNPTSQFGVSENPSSIYNQYQQANMNECEQNNNNHNQMNQSFATVSLQDYNRDPINMTFRRENQVATQMSFSNQSFRGDESALNQSRNPEVMVLEANQIHQSSKGLDKLKKSLIQ